MHAMFQAYSAIFITLNILWHVCPHSNIFRQIQAYSESSYSQTYSCILGHFENLIQALFRDYSRATYAYSESYIGRFRHIQNSGMFRHVMFHTYSGIFTKLHKLRHTWTYFSRFRYIQDSGISSSNNINQHLRVKSGSSFKSLFKSI